MRIQVVLTLPREAVSVPLARHIVSAALDRAGIDGECLAEVEIALTEACTNVFQHAEEGGDTYDVVINVGEEYLTVDVVDSGPGFDHASVTDTALPDDHAESGRGIAMMQFFADRTVFDSVDGGGGAVHLSKRLRWAEDAPLLRRPARVDRTRDA